MYPCAPRLMKYILPKRSLHSIHLSNKPISDLRSGQAITEHSVELNFKNK